MNSRKEKGPPRAKAIGAEEEPEDEPKLNSTNSRRVTEDQNSLVRFPIGAAGDTRVIHPMNNCGQ